jgi:hypothetical protein
VFRKRCITTQVPFLTPLPSYLLKAPLFELPKLPFVVPSDDTFFQNDYASSTDLTKRFPICRSTKMFVCPLLLKNFTLKVHFALFDKYVA